MPSDNQFTALGPASVGFQTDGANITTGAVITGTENGVVGTSTSTKQFTYDAVLGTNKNGTGVHGESTLGTGVFGHSEKGFGVDGRSDSGYGGNFATGIPNRIDQPGLAQIRLEPSMVIHGPPREGNHQMGELFADADGNLFYCTSGGTPGIWMRVQLVKLT